MTYHIFAKKLYLFICISLIISVSSSIFAQNSISEKDAFLENVRYGGSFGLSFSNNFFNANLAPKAIYDFNRLASAGVGLLGSYTNGSFYSAYTFGGSMIGILRPVQQLQLSAEFEELNVTRIRELDGGNRKDSYWYPALFLGAGYTTGPVTVGVRYDVLFNDDKSIYGNALMPFVSVYF
ncbi:alpha-ketoglutarate decarboxylase [Salinimicrobium sp. GXAS 041]|uniref:alpha-ketoglutarate decarboxylase n=1 Tax=Salinimicrobium sp. GXAS 041 TaxID=3400806 RepID=UPI003C75E5E8